MVEIRICRWRLGIQWSSMRELVARESVIAIQYFVVLPMMSLVLQVCFIHRAQLWGRVSPTLMLLKYLKEEFNWPVLVIQKTKMVLMISWKVWGCALWYNMIVQCDTSKLFFFYLFFPLNLLEYHSDSTFTCILYRLDWAMLILQVAS